MKTIKNNETPCQPLEAVESPHLPAPPTDITLPSQTAPKGVEEGSMEGSAGYSNEEALEKLWNCLDSGAGEHLGLTLEKVCSRGVNLKEAPGHPGKFLFDIERHRAIAGASYRKGLPMSAFETYTQNYSFDPDSGTIEELDEKRISIKFDAYGLASEIYYWNFNPQVYRRKNWKKKRRVKVAICHFYFDTSSLEVACKKIEDRFRAMPHDLQFEGLDMDAEFKSNLVNEVEDAFVMMALVDLKKGWADPEPLD